MGTGWRGSKVYVVLDVAADGRVAESVPFSWKYHDSKRVLGSGHVAASCQKPPCKSRPFLSLRPLPVPITNSVTGAAWSTPFALPLSAKSNHRMWKSVRKSGMAAESPNATSPA